MAESEKTAAGTVEGNHRGEDSIRRGEKGKEKEVALEEQVWSWGAGTDGQLATSKLQDEFLPQLLHLPSLSSAGPISVLACGGAHVIALTSGGKVLTWGRGTSGQLGHGEMISSLIPNPIKSLEDIFITHVSAGWSHSGFVSDTGCVFTCGDGTFGQLGHGDYRSHCSPVKVSYFVNDHVRQIACGMRHSLVLLSGGQVYGFGAGKRGQLGISVNKIKSINLPQLTSLEHVKMVAISANGDRSVALSADSQLYIWGKKFDGASDVQRPKLIHSSFRVTEAALGWNHVLVLSDDGEVFMLGGTHHGVLSDLEKTIPPKDLSAGSGEPVLEKVPSLDGVKVLQIAAGAEHSALVTDDGAVKTWGWGEHGQLGLGTTSDQKYPQKVDLGHDFPGKDATLRVYCGSGFTYAIRSACSSNEA